MTRRKSLYRPAPARRNREFMPYQFNDWAAI
ncbi:hypothetical protein rosmuc_02053 [Roseovarius mucosus DSM 17069]|uniref:Uncharacterized protein n=1 Tax=Roseovarius mucosus DSM 17069 TaxID=1288298 RepID=A0A0A0HMG9_9RHOB|nr:hypothetical protein rosmuc_02053 [Roseovarius mucosus DSM 17069]